MNLVSVASTSPHAVTDGYTLRVKSVVEYAARLPGVRAHVVAPVPANELIAAQAWAQRIGVTLHATEYVASSDWDPAHRAAFKRDVPRILREFRISEDARIIVHGLQPAVDLAQMPDVGRCIADMIDEASPRMCGSVRGLLLSGRLLQCLRDLNDFRCYRESMIPRFAAYRCVVVVAHDDAQRVRWALPGTRTEVVPNGVATPVRSTVTGLPRTPVALFQGVFSYQPNESAALFLIRRVAPLVQRHLPAWRIRLVGRAPTRAIREEASRSHCVEVVADAPDMHEHLSTAALGVYPVFMRTGIQNKVLEALAYGLPVVTTPDVKTVFTRFDPDASSCIHAARSGRGFARRMRTLAGSPDLMQRMSDAGRAYVAQNFTWERAVNRLLDI